MKKMGGIRALGLGEGICDVISLCHPRDSFIPCNTYKMSFESAFELFTRLDLVRRRNSSKAATEAGLICQGTVYAEDSQCWV